MKFRNIADSLVSFPTPDYQGASSDTAYHDSANEINLYETVLIKELWVRMGKVP